MYGSTAATAFPLPPTIARSTAHYHASFGEEQVGPSRVFADTILASISLPSISIMWRTAAAILACGKQFFVRGFFFARTSKGYTYPFSGKTWNERRLLQGILRRSSLCICDTDVYGDKLAREEPRLDRDLTMQAYIGAEGKRLSVVLSFDGFQAIRRTNNSIEERGGSP